MYNITKKAAHFDDILCWEKVCPRIKDKIGEYRSQLSSASEIRSGWSQSELGRHRSRASR